MWIAVHLIVELKLKNFLRLLDQEATNGLWDSVLHVSQDNVKVLINSFSHFLNVRIGASAHVWLVGHAWRSAHVHLFLLPLIRLVLGSNNIRPALFVPSVVCEEETFSIDNSFDNFSGLFSFFAKCFHNDVHHFWDHSWETLEDLVHNATRQLLKLGITLLNQFKCWVSQFVDLWGYQVDEDID